MPRARRRGSPRCRRRSPRSGRQGGGGIPHAVQRRFEIGGQHRSGGGHVARQHVDRRCRHDVSRLMRMQNEDGPALELAWSALDAADTRIAVFDRSRKLAFLKRGRASAPTRSAGRCPLNTSDSVPRLIPLNSVWTTTSSSAGGRSGSRRISPRPGATTQNALASSVMHRHSYACTRAVTMRPCEGVRPPSSIWPPLAPSA